MFAQLEDMSRLIADQSMELDGVIELHERLEAKTEECESLAEKLAELEARMGIQSEELAADTDARIVRIGNRLARPLFTNVYPVRRRGVRALLDECARL